LLFVVWPVGMEPSTRALQPTADPADMTPVLATAQPKQLQVAPVLLQALGDFVRQFWWLILMVGAILAARGLVWLIRERRLARSGISEIDRMDGITFERRLVHLFTSRGYRVEQTRARGDYGADLILEKNGARTVVQAKRWKKNVGVKAVQEAVAAKPMYRCDHSMVVTNRYFTEQARRLARANGVRLWNRDDLVRALLANADEGLAPAAPPASG
jgi:restriction system protein